MISDIKITTGMKRLSLILVTILLCLTGCDSQSPHAKFVDGMDVLLMRDSGGNRWQLDHWNVDDEIQGQDIFSAQFGFQIKTVLGGVSPPAWSAGIRIDCYVEHCDPTGGSYDIWDNTCPNGEKYGFVNGYPSSVAHWSHAKGHASVKTDADGRARFYIGLGDPDNDDDAGYLWPGGCDTMISTGVKLRFVIRRSNGDIVTECHCYFIRGQCAGFWWPTGQGVWDMAYSSLEPAPEIWPLSPPIEDPCSTDYETPSPIQEIEPRNCPPNEYPIELAEKLLVPDVNESWVYESRGWWQLIWNPDMGGWVWVQRDYLTGLISPDPNIPNDGADMLTMCHPHAFLCSVYHEDAGLCDSLAHTVIVKSKTADGNDVSWRPVYMVVYGIYPDQNEILFYSEYILPIDSPVGEGRYFDWYGWPGTFIYVPEGGHLELEVDPFYGDFNFDGTVNFLDFCGFAFFWQKDITYRGYDLMFDATRDGRTTIEDLKYFSENWLETRP